MSPRRQVPELVCGQLFEQGADIEPRLTCLNREKARLASDPDADQDTSDRLGLSSSDTLTNGSRHADVAAAKRLAKRLFNLDGFRKSDVARHLSKK